MRVQRCTWSGRREEPGACTYDFLSMRGSNCALQGRSPPGVTISPLTAIAKSFDQSGFTPWSRLLAAKPGCLHLCAGPPCRVREVCSPASATNYRAGSTCLLSLCRSLSAVMGKDACCSLQTRLAGQHSPESVLVAVVTAFQQSSTLLLIRRQVRLAIRPRGRGGANASMPCPDT